MTREEAKVLLPIIQAFSEGRKIMVKDRRLSDEEYNWSEVDNCSFNIKQFEYRIKPEPTYRPFKNAEECWEEMQKHKYFGWIKGKDTSIPSRFMIINSVRDEEVSITSGIDFTYSELVEYYTFIDGTPFGIKEEE